MLKITSLLAALLFFTLGCSKETRKEFYPDGTLMSSCEYNKDGMLDGVCKRYYQNGFLQTEASYKDNVLNGQKKNTMKAGR